MQRLSGCGALSDEDLIMLLNDLNSLPNLLIYHSIADKASANSTGNMESKKPRFGRKRKDIEMTGICFDLNLRDLIFFY